MKRLIRIEGKFGNALLFDGSPDAWARFINPASLTNFTLCAWVKVTSFTNTYPKMFQLGNCYYQFQTANPGLFSLGIGSAPRADWMSNGTAPFIATTGSWLHTAVVIKRTYTSATEWVAQPIFYINGVRCGTLQTPKSYTPDAAGAGNGFLGNSGVSGTRAFDGAMDEVRIYDQALSDREVLDVYQNCPVAVDAGSDQISHRSAVLLRGRVSSTNPYSRAIAATSLWSVVSAPPGALPQFEFPALPVTAVTLPASGTYIFRLTAFGELGRGSNDVSVTQVAGEPSGNAAPVVTPASASVTAVLGTGAALAASVSDDGVPGPVQLCWSKISGPGGVFFDNACTSNTTAFFTTNGVYVLQPGKSGNGLRFPKADSYARATIFTNAECFTFSLWLYYDAAYTNNVGKRIFDYGASRFYMYFNPDKVYLATRNLADTSDYAWTQQNYSLENDRSQWVHLAVLYDRRPSAAAGKQQAFYINGVSTGSSVLGGACDGSKAFTTGYLFIGGNGSIRNFDGVFDEMRVYDRLLTAEEIRLLAADPDNNHAPVIESPAGLTVQVGESVGSLATVYDDGQPRGGSLTTAWSVVAGDAARVLFGDAGDPATAITFTKSGDYVLMLSATDGELSNAVKIQISAASSGTLLLVL